MAESKAALSEAKAYMAELGLELNKLPPVVMPNENDEFVFKAGTLGMQTRTDDPYMKELEKRTNDGMQAFEVREELWNSVVFSRAYRIVELAPGGGEFERNVAAVSKGKKVILLRRTGYHDMRAGSESESHVLVYDFTTPPPLKEGPKPPMPTLGTAVYDSVEVLGYNPDNTMFAYRIIAHHEPIYDQVGVSIDCRYGGQKEFPTSGVTLHAASLAEPNTVTSFTVYAAAPTPEDCTSRPAAEEGLAKAKAHFKQLGIDIGRSPKRILPTGEPQVLALGNGDTFSISPGERISAGYLLGKRLVLILEPSSYEPFRIEALE